MQPSGRLQTVVPRTEASPRPTLSASQPAEQLVNQLKRLLEILGLEADVRHVSNSEEHNAAEAGATITFLQRMTQAASNAAAGAEPEQPPAEDLELSTDVDDDVTQEDRRP